MSSEAAPAAEPAKLALRVKSKKSQNAILRDVNSQWKVSDLLAKLSDLTEVPRDKMALLTGFPPKRISYEVDDLVESLGLKHQDTLIVELDDSGAPNKADGGSSAKKADGAEDAIASKTPAASSEEAKPDNTQSTEQKGNGGPSYEDFIPVDDDDNGLLLRQIVPSDNSCLFTSVKFCLSGGAQRDTDEGCSMLREMIANTVAADPAKYNEAMLGRPNKEYVNWIKKPESWGGGIELSILAEFYGIQISVVDTQSLHISCFGEDHNFSQRMFLIYDGIHYDPLYFEPFTGGSTRTVFPTSDSKMMELAMQLAKEAKASHQFTDVKNFSLRCQVCNSLLKGETEAQAHAKKTGHTAFAEIQKNK